MADPLVDSSKASSTFPDPPPFWQDFTPERIARFESLKQQHADRNGLDATAVVRVPNVPEDLICLQPPAEPADGKWRLFGEAQNLDDELQGLEAAGIDRLVPASETDQDGKHIDRAFALKRLTKSMLLNFLEWMGVMAISPEQGSEKVQDIRTLLLNIHHSLNEYRPHQAREQLIATMQNQLDSKRAETAAIRSVVDKARRVLEGLGSVEAAAAGQGQAAATATATATATTGTVGTETAIPALVGAAARKEAEMREREETRREREQARWAALESDFA